MDDYFFGAFLVLQIVLAQLSSAPWRAPTGAFLFIRIFMNRQYLSKRALLFLIAGLTLAEARSAPVALNKKTISFVAQISKTPDGNLCIVGSASDPDGELTEQGSVIIFNPAANKIVWQKTLNAPDDMANARFVSCKSDGKNTYVGANVDTSSAVSLSHTFTFIFKFDEHGELIAKHNLVTGNMDSLVYDLDVDARGVTVVGMDRGEDATHEKYALYFAKLDPALKKEQVTRLSTGAFDLGAIAKFSNNETLLAGNFYPASVSKKTLVEDYAVSKISPARKYQFSVRPQKTPPENIATAFSPSDEIISLGYSKGMTQITVVSSEGKIVQDLHLKSPFCKTSSLNAESELLYAIRTGCADNQAKVMSITRKDGIEKVLDGVAGEPLYVFPLEATLFVVAKKADGSLLLQTIPKRQRTSSTGDRSQIAG